MNVIWLLDHARAALRSLLTPGERMIDEIECATSVLLAILLSHLLGTQHVAWAAFTGFVLMRSQATETLVRALLRIIGTAAGAGLALLIAPLVTPSLSRTSAAVAVFGATGLYGMLTGKRAYAWLLFGITFEMVLLGKLEHPAADMNAFAETRFIEVIAGTVACVFVSLTTVATARRRWPGTRSTPAARIGWHPHAARHAAQTGVALAMLPPLHVLFGLAELEQAAVTVMAVMVVPVSGLGASGLVPVGLRLVHRTIGCLSGSLFALVFLVVAQGSIAILVVGTCLGVLIGRHVENAGSRFVYVGLQFTLAVIVVLVPDSYADAAITPALQRLLSILVGMALLGPVLLGHLIFVRARWSSTDPTLGKVE